MRNITIDHKRQTSNHRHQNPRKCYRHEAFPLAYAGIGEFSLRFGDFITLASAL